MHYYKAYNQLYIIYILYLLLSYNSQMEYLCINYFLNAFHYYIIHINFLKNIFNSLEFLFLLQRIYHFLNSNLIHILNIFLLVYNTYIFQPNPNHLLVYIFQLNNLCNILCHIDHTILHFQNEDSFQDFFMYIFNQHENNFVFSRSIDNLNLNIVDTQLYNLKYNFEKVKSLKDKFSL